MECTKVNCPMQAGTKTDNCGENCPWKTTTKIGDLISRAAAIKEIEDLMQHYRQIGAEYDRDGALFARERIKKLPAVNAIPIDWMESQYYKHMEIKDKYMSAYAIVLAEWNE